MFSNLRIAHVFDVNAQGMGQVGTHGIAVRGDLRLLAGNGAVGIDKLKAQLARIVHYAGKQHHRVGTLVGGVGVGEQLSDITQRGRAQQRVHHRMRQHIRVRMAKQPLFIRHRHTA